MTAMNLYLPEPTMLKVQQGRALSAAVAMPFLLAEILQVLKGAIVPMNRTHAALDEHLSRDLGLR